jgi:TolA-binding protein
MMHAIFARFCTILCLIAWLFAVHLPMPATAAPAAADGTSLYAFGRHLLNIGDYYRAITELKRFSLLFPQHPQYPASQVLLGLAFQENDEIDNAIAQFQRLSKAHAQTDFDRLATFKLGELRFFQQDYRLASTVFQRFLRRFPDGPLTNRTTYLLGLSLALDGQDAQAQSVLNTLPVHTPWSEPATTLQQTLQTPPPAPLKSTRTAGILAGILPGAGHLYLGKPRHAITAFLLNGLFISGTVFAFLEGLEATGLILLYFETGWYLGNINSAVEGANDYNLQQQQARRDHLLSTYAPSSLNLRQLQGPGIGLRLSF